MNDNLERIAWLFLCQMRGCGQTHAFLCGATKAEKGLIVSRFQRKQLHEETGLPVVSPNEWRQLVGTHGPILLHHDVIAEICSDYLRLKAKEATSDAKDGAAHNAAGD